AGGASISSGTAVDDGKTVIFTAAPDAGYRVKEWKNGTSAVSGNVSNTLTISGLSSDTVITVEFEAVPAPPAPADDGLPWLLLIGVIIIVAAIALAVYWFVIRKK
ncbi:MAG: hypothetical protein LBH69_05065, partial [Methanomassiliicoccaceae archaeon]|nr:hypothetical protein [Methanomassiliicoccaceae archaeon]